VKRKTLPLRKSSFQREGEERPGKGAGKGGPPFKRKALFVLSPRRYIAGGGVREKKTSWFSYSSPFFFFWFRENRERREGDVKFPKGFVQSKNCKSLRIEKEKRKNKSALKKREKGSTCPWVLPQFI